MQWHHHCQSTWVSFQVVMRLISSSIWVWCSSSIWNKQRRTESVFNMTERIWATSPHSCTHIKDVQVVVYQILYDLHLVFPFPVSLKQTGSEQQRQVLGAHLVQIGTLLDPEREKQQVLPLHSTASTNTAAAAARPVSAPPGWAHLYRWLMRAARVVRLTRGRLRMISL